jgi:hypothetical protein
MVMINFHAKLKPALKNKAKSFFAPSTVTTSACQISVLIRKVARCIRAHFSL